METDFQILCWLHERLVNVHGESELMDYMHAFRRVIASLNPQMHSTTSGGNSLAEMRDLLAQPQIDAINEKYGRG